MRQIAVLVVEDNDVLRDLTVDFLQEAGHRARGAADAPTMDEMLAAESADVVVLDVNLPGEDGLSICRRLRAASPGLGVIMLTAMGDTAYRVRGYQEGADIYLAKPTSSEELEAAVVSVARRYAVLSVNRREQAALRLLLDEMALVGPSGRQGLSDAELRLLRGLLLAAGHRLESWQLLELLGLVDEAEAKAALEVRITRLRKKLMAAGGDEPGIKSLRGWGYQLTCSLIIG